jgi:transposase-like protein
MSERKKRTVHGAELKAKVELEAVRGVKTINEIAQEYGVHPVQVSPMEARNPSESQNPV